MPSYLAVVGVQAAGIVKGGIKRLVVALRGSGTSSAQLKDVEIAFVAASSLWF